MIVAYMVEMLKADSAIGGHFGGRIYPQNAPDAPTYPFLVVSKIAGVPDYDMQGESGIERARIQVDLLDLGYSSIEEWSRIVARYLTARPQPQPASGPACTIDSIRVINDFDSPAGSPDGSTERAGPRVRRRILDLTVFWRRT